VGGRLNDGLAAGNPVGREIDEAADHEPNEDEVNGEERSDLYQVIS
jgi:hypothetical protein